MKTYLFTFLLSFFSFGSFAVNITISLKENPNKPLKIKILSYKSIAQADTIYTLTLPDTEPRIFDLPLSTFQFISIQSQNFIEEFYIDPSQEYQFIYDERKKKIEMTGGNIDLNKRIKSDFDTITSRLKIRQPDSATFVNQFLYLTDSLKLYNNTFTNESERIRHHYNRCIAFYNFVEISNGYNLFRFDASATDSITRKIISLINLNEIDLSAHSPMDFYALRYYHLSYAYDIFRIKESSSGEMDRTEFYEKINNWTSELTAQDEIKAFLIGDFISFYSNMGQYKFTKEALVYLEEYLIKYPDAPHSEWIEKEYKKRYDQLFSSSVLVIDCNDVEGKSFRASAYDEKLLFIDFWATWCGPCIAENPYIEQLKKEYAGKVRFIKISVDEYESGWRLFLGKDRKNTKNSYLLSRNNRTDTMNYYDLNAIPKFMIVDGNGQILDFSPPRPSNPKVREVLDSLLK